MLVRALRRQGADVTLVPLYTPLLTEEPDQSISQVFFGGLSVYLRQVVPLADRLPRFLSRWLDRPVLLRAISRSAIRTDARRLGALTLSMVRGEHGRQRADAARLVEWLARQPRPDAINFGNLLVAGCVPLLKRKLGVPIIVTLQGDDLFLDGLTPTYRDAVHAELKRIVRDVDGFLAHSQYYAAEMARRFEIPRERIHVVPLGISLSGMALATGDHDEHNPGPAAGAVPLTKLPSAPTVGFLARICPAKGLHALVEAFIRLRGMPGMSGARLYVAGWLGPDDEDYFRQQQQRLAEAGHAEALHLIRAPDRAAKLQFLREIDVLSVPTVYQEPKGRYVLEALAAGVPVVQPRHGAFPELLASTGGGKLFEPGDAAGLATSLFELLLDTERRQALGRQGQAGVAARHGDEHTAQATLAVYRRFVPNERQQ